MGDKHFEDSLSRVISQFEGWEDCIEKSFQESEDFRSLCEDYVVCARVLEDWQVSTAANAGQRRQEYTELLTELAKEIEDWLEQRHVNDQQKR